MVKNYNLDFFGVIIYCEKLGRSSLYSGASDNPSFRLKSKTQILEVSFQKREKFKTLCQLFPPSSFSKAADSDVW